ncbi:MAG TPA: aminotransferase class V-fold PLP-dependent enzyme [Xanthomonadaceae bacterium]|nr:aminotransferase class V-fold PLP-dependent enzyme [Xanthomonadaceae bacterium]
MALSRRDFLARNGLAVAAALVPGDLLAAAEAATPPMPDLGDWAAVRAQFALSPRYRHFSSFFIASHPRPVAEAIDGFRRAIDENPFLVVERGLFEGPEHSLPLHVQQAAAEYLGTRPEQIALTGNTTTGLALVYHGLPLQAGDEVLTTRHDHYSHHESIRLATARAGASMRAIALFEEPAEATVEGIVARILAGIGPRTRVLGITWVHSSSGVRLPVREIAAALAKVNAGRDPAGRVLLVVDGVHGIGAVDEDIAAMGCDFFCAGTHKWLFGPRGTGLVWATPEAWALLRPTVPSFSSEEPYMAWMQGREPSAPNTADRVSPGGFHAYEHQWGMAAAFRMHQAIGRSRVGERIAQLNTRCKQGLSRIDGVRLHTPMDPALSAGVICFEVAGLETQQTVARLLEKGIIASGSPYAVSWVRLAPSLVNTPGEVDEALAAVRSLRG